MQILEEQEKLDEKKK